MILFPSETLLSAQKGIALWAGNILPALLPFFICVGVLNGAGVSLFLPKCAYVFLMSVFSGYPMGARIIGDMRRKGYISLHEAKQLLPLGSTTGPAFIFGAVGAGMFGSLKAGSIIAAAHYTAVFITAGVMKIYASKDIKPVVIRYMESNDSYKQRCEGAMKEVKILEMLTEAILEALKSLGIILAYIVMFIFVTDMIQKACVFTEIGNPFMSACLKGVLEMTVGCAAISNTDIAFEFQIAAAAFMISFGGFSVIGQSMSMLADSGISFSYFVLIKLMHGAAAAVIALILTLW